MARIQLRDAITLKKIPMFNRKTLSTALAPAPVILRDRLVVWRRPASAACAPGAVEHEAAWLRTAGSKRI